MKLEEIADLALKKAQQAKDYTDILNVFSAHLYCYRAQAQAYELEHYWARERDDLVYANAQGREAVVDFYVNTNKKMREKKWRLACEIFPELQKAQEQDGIGDMVAKASSSPYVIIAEDGASAHGIWFVPGLCCELGPGGQIKANYFQEKNAVDLVKESDGWKILRLDILVDFQTPCPDIDFSPENYQFDYPSGDYAQPYSKLSVAHFCPPLPDSYDTWENTSEFQTAY